MRHVVFDIETNGLLPELTTIHSLVLRDLDSEAVVSCSNDPRWEGPTIEKGLALLMLAEKVYGHNIIGFDLPAIQKLYPNFKLEGRYLDTLVTAGLRFAHIKDSDFQRFAKKQLPGDCIGSHSLKAWGYRLRVLKGDFGDTTDWSVWSPEMQQYCERDTLVTKELVFYLRKAGVSPEAVETEHELAAYLFQQEQNGWPFDTQKAQALAASLTTKKTALEQQLREMFPPWQQSLGMFVPKANNKKRGYVKGVPLERFRTVEFNPESGDHIANRLISLYGWKPQAYTANGKPQVDENALKGLEYPPVPVLREYLLVGKRLEQLLVGKQAWLRHVRKDGRIHGKVWQNGTITHRASHSNPNIAQVPKVGSPYGAECRELFTVPEGWVMVGADASSLEARCLGHYVAKYDGGKFGQTALAEKPNDLHTANAGILGASRDSAKTWFYAFLYGAGDEKLGKILHPGKKPAAQKKLGKKNRKQFLSGLRALGLLVKAIQAKAKQTGYLNLIDGRRCYIRSEHAALNSLLQGTGSVICKRWIVEFNRRLVAQFGPQGWDGRWAALGWIHDEVQLAVRKEDAEAVAAVLVESIRAMAEHFNFRLPLEGEAKFGANWKETH